jgi:hypothetical protein
MVGWYDLPLEVVDAILSSLANAIVKEYQAQGYSFILDEPQPTRKVPQPLRNFSKVSKTCRYFHDALTHRIKVNGQTCSAALQGIAHENLVGLSNTTRRILKDDGEGDDVQELGSLEDRFISVAGRFWHNPKVIRDPSLGNLFLLLPYKSVAALIPKLGAWVKQNLVPSSSPTKVATIGLRGTVFSEEVQVKRGPQWVCGEQVEVFSIESIVKQSERRPGTT